MKRAVFVGVSASAAILVAAVVGTRYFNSSAAPSARLDVTIPQESVSEPEAYIKQFEGSSDPTAQSHVTRARMTVAFDAASSKDYKKASELFLAASEQHKGSNAMSPAYGTLSDQARYQAIVCLEADGQIDAAVSGYRKFMEERMESPLVHQCHRRLERIHGVSKGEDDQRLQAAVDAQQKRIRFETSVCGPKAIERLLPLIGKKQVSYVEIAKLAGTSDSGTTLEGMQSALSRLGVKSYGLELNARDFRALKKPALWLTGDHYILLEKIESGKAHTYDPRFNLESIAPLPKDEEQFRAMMLVLELPDSDLSVDRNKQTS